MKYYSWVRDKIKRLCVWLRGCVWCLLWVSMRALFIVLSIFNDNCSLNTCLLLNNEWYEIAPRTWKVKKSILGVSEEPLDQNRERASYRQLLNAFCLTARPTQELARSSELIEWPSDFFCQFLLEQSIFQDSLHFFINHH